MPVKEDKLPEAIKFIANLRSINLGDKEIKYLLTYSNRSMSSLLDAINKLDELSMQLKRKITIPLIKEII
jgi:DnaA family protein